jgi:hypothetical protein
VRGNNTWGEGEWSDVKSVTVFNFFDDFSDYQSGWPREWEKTRGALYQVRPDEHPSCPGSGCPYDDGDGYLIARRSGSEPTARFGPDVKVPSGNYEIEVDVRWYDAAYYATYQIFFGSDDDFENYYAVQVRINIEGSSDDCEYRVVEHKTSLAGYGMYKIESENELQGWTDPGSIRCDVDKDADGAKWDNWKIRREGDEITLWINGDKEGPFEDDTFGANRYFGVGATIYEGFTPSKPVFDNFRVRLFSSD